MRELHPEYITDESGTRKSVVLPVEEYEALLEDIDDLVKIAERAHEPTVDHETVIRQLKEDGYL